jgi:hypothetical protein
MPGTLETLEMLLETTGHWTLLDAAGWLKPIVLEHWETLETLEPLGMLEPLETLGTLDAAGLWTLLDAIGQSKHYQRS